MASGFLTGYKHRKPFDYGYIAVEPPHELYYERYGSISGKPVVFLHGGPGSNISTDNASFFDPKAYHIILFNQRGAGRSKPLAEVQANTILDLIGDIELLKRHFEIKKWHMVFGGSWGSTLALAYAQTYPTSVGSLVLRGVLLGTKEELDSIHSSTMCKSFFPDAYESWLKFLPTEHRVDPHAAYYNIMMSDDMSLRRAAARAWNKRELSMSQIDETTEIFSMLEDEDWSLAHAKLELHYFHDNLFLEPGQLLLERNIKATEHIPTSIVHGRNDILCPPAAAWSLHKALPNSKLFLIPGAGHSANEPATKSKLVEVCDEFRRLLMT
ncbi:prolyl aminopeptidase [Myriangium duriaei CBS 260.36]|uniref:Proline iminopeptidase n=1 Tax=Myriangium duriaei CBS 260.36 TaxID=1168546 RepID=A0A9P4IZX6_9PEZI|nr:prolyl aminopeptidase [Myriangium duriaei CBS 260.36]